MQWLMIMSIRPAIPKGVIMMCSKDRHYQEFIVEGAEFKKAKHDFFKTG